MGKRNILICLLLFCLGWNAHGQTDDVERRDSLLRVARSGVVVRISDDTTSSVVGRVPDVAKEVVLDSILARHRGKVLFVDFWYVYCVSCKAAMLEMEPVRGEFARRGVEFIYVTGDKASPRNHWERMIPGMPGTHYRLPDEAYRYLIDERFRMPGLPYYLIVDKEGKIVYRGAGFMGCDEMRRLLEKELKR